MNAPVILILEDEPDLLQVVALAVRRALPGYRIRTAGDLVEAEAVLADLEARGTVLALVVADHVVGGGTGLDLLTAVQQRFGRVPSVLFTGRAPPRVEAEARRVGARVLWKPLRLSQLVGHVTEMLAS